MLEVDYEEGTYETSFLYNSDGKLYRVICGYSVYTIDYSQLSSGVLVLDYDNTTYGEGAKTVVTLNAEGYAQKAEKTPYDSDEVSSVTEFTYDADGRLVKVVGTDDYGTLTSLFTYVGDNVEQLSSTSGDEDDDFTVKFSYSESSPEVNGLTLYGSIYGADIYELEYLGLAGYLGKSPAQLPTALTWYEPDGSFYGAVTWTTDADGYATKVSNAEGYTEFTWQENSGVDAIAAPVEGGAEAYYSIDGTRLSGLPQSGIVIVRSADGKVRKHVVR